MRVNNSTGKGTSGMNKFSSEVHRVHMELGGMWYVVCLAALTAMLRGKGIMFSTLARTGLEPAVVETRAVDLLLAALKDFAACEGSFSSFFDLGQTHPFVYARPNGSLAVSLQLPPLRVYRFALGKGWPASPCSWLLVDQPDSCYLNL